MDAHPMVPRGFGHELIAGGEELDDGDQGLACLLAEAPAIALDGCGEKHLETVVGKFCDRGGARAVESGEEQLGVLPVAYGAAKSSEPP